MYLSLADFWATSCAWKAGIVEFGCGDYSRGPGELSVNHERGCKLRPRSLATLRQQNHILLSPRQIY